jgi:hypothetical protein
MSVGALVLTVSTTVARPVPSVSEVGVAKLPPAEPIAHAIPLHSFDQTTVFPDCETGLLLASTNWAVTSTVEPAVTLLEAGVTR